MIAMNLQRVYRELCGMEAMRAQAEIAKACGCSLSYVNKIIKKLKEKNYIHQPFKNRIAILNFQNLLLMWSFARDIENERIDKIKTKYSVDELEKRVNRLKKYSFTLFTAAKLYGIKEVPYDAVHVYTNCKVDMEAGNKATLVVIKSDDEHLYSKSEKVNGMNVVCLPQLFADLTSLGTWEAKLVLNKISELDGKYPVFGTKREIGT